MKEFTIKIDMSEFATKQELREAFLDLEDSINKLGKMMMEQFERVAPKDELLSLEKNHETRIELLEDDMKDVRKKLTRAQPELC